MKMKNNAKLLSAIAISVLIAASLASIVLYDRNVMNDDDGIALGAPKDPGFFADNGYIEISTETEFKMIGVDPGYPANGNYYLSDDIAITSPFVGVGTKTIPFRGIFDGNGHTISDAYVSVMSGTYPELSRGLFSYVGGNAQIIDLGSVNNLFVIFTVSTLTYTGCIIGFVEEHSNVTVTNCYSIGGTAYSASGVVSSAGGIVGHSLGNVTINGCYTNNYSIDARGASAYAGGLIGYCVNAEITDSYNRGSVHSATSQMSSVGGLVGYMPSGTLTVTNCYNSGPVTVPMPSGTLTPADYGGGIIGYKAKGDMTISQCYNSGKITVSSTSKPAIAGGIMGAASTDPSATGDYLITDCYNIGNVSATSSGSDAYAAGILGYSAVTVSVVNCYSTGPVAGTSVSYDAYAAGIIAYSADAVICSCYFLEGSVTNNGTSEDVLANFVTANVDGNADGTPRDGPKGSGVKGTDDIAADLTETRKGNAIYFIDATDGIAGWNFEKIWTIIDGVNNNYPIFGISPPLDDEDDEDEDDEDDGGTCMCPPGGIKGKLSDIWPFIVAAAVLSTLVLFGLLWSRKDELEIGEMGVIERTGSQISPTPWVRYNGTLLKAGEDFTYSYGENINEGAGTVTVTLGKRNRKVTVTFLIAARN